MNISTTLAQFLGIIFVVIGASIIIDKKGVVAVVDEAARNRGFLWALGLIALVMGATFVMLNDIWTSGLPLFVTVVGWLILIKGCYILLFPDSAVSLYKKYGRRNVFVSWAAIVLVVGLALLYIGFI